LIRIPLRGVTPSLNASVATALCLYEVARRGWMKGLQGQNPSPPIVRPQLSPAPSESAEASDSDAIQPSDAPDSPPAAPEEPAIDLQIERLPETAAPSFDGSIDL
jgi:23S rRNA (guanosine2251-2'-O)-methyltransferase